MANYLYKTVVYIDTTNVVNPPANNSTNLTDYETNHQADTTKVDDLQIAETTFVVDKSYSDFSDLITTPYDWGDVKEHEHGNKYELFLITTSPLE